jgi:hypothetical protein
VGRDGQSKALNSEKRKRFIFYPKRLTTQISLMRLANSHFSHRRDRASSGPAWADSELNNRQLLFYAIQALERTPAANRGGLT